MVSQPQQSYSHGEPSRSQASPPDPCRGASSSDSPMQRFCWGRCGRPSESEEIAPGNSLRLPPASPERGPVNGVDLAPAMRQSAGFPPSIYNALRSERATPPDVGEAPLPPRPPPRRRRDAFLSSSFRRPTPPMNLSERSFPPLSISSTPSHLCRALAPAPRSRPSSRPL